MSTLPRAIEFSMAGFSFRVIHGGVTRINRFIFPSSDQQTKLEELQQAECDVIIGGHSGLPFGDRLGNSTWLNAGVIGLPANDGTTDGWYLLLNPRDGQIDCEWQRLQYDFVRSQQSMLAAGLDDYAESLVSGLWPSMDILPEQERGKRGQRIEPFSLTLSPR